MGFRCGCCLTAEGCLCQVFSSGQEGQKEKEGQEEGQGHRDAWLSLEGQMLELWRQSVECSAGQEEEQEAEEMSCADLVSCLSHVNQVGQMRYQLDSTEEAPADLHWNLYCLYCADTTAGTIGHTSGDGTAKPGQDRLFLVSSDAKCTSTPAFKIWRPAWLRCRCSMVLDASAPFSIFLVVVTVVAVVVVVVVGSCCVHSRGRVC